MFAQGAINLMANPGLADLVAGLSTTAAYQAGVDRLHMWQRRNETVMPYNISLATFVAAVSNLRNMLDGAPVS